MQIPKSLPYVIGMALPRSAASYAAYVAAPLLMINWLASRSYATMGLLFLFLVGSAFINWALGLSFSFTNWALELGLILPFLAAALGVATSRHFNGRSFIRVLNVVMFATSMISLVRAGFPLRLPYVHYLPDLYNGGFGNGGAKIVTVIGFFGVLEALTRKRQFTLRDNATLILSTLNFIVPNFILGIISGLSALVILVRRNRAILFAGAALLMIIFPYLQYRAEQRNDEFSQYYGTNPKIYAFIAVGQLYRDEPHTVIVGTGLGQFTSQPAIWASPINRWLGTHELPQLPGMFSSEVHNKFVAPVLLRFKTQRFALSSSANKPYAGFSQMLAELGLPMTLLLLYSAYHLFWRRSRGDFGKAVFLFIVAVNLLDPQIDSPWFGALLLASLDAIARDARVKSGRVRKVPASQGGSLAPARKPDFGTARATMPISQGQAGT